MHRLLILELVSELEETSDQPHTPDHARQLLTRLQSLDGDFQRLHFELIDLIDEKDTDTLETEQDIVDKHADDVSAIVCLQALSTPTDVVVPPT